MSKNQNSKISSFKNTSPVSLIIVAIIGLLIGIFFCSLSTRFKIITKEQAIAFSGEFSNYETGKNYCGISFADGSYYEIYPHTEPKKFSEAMNELEAGTTLHILIEPNCEYVIEVKTDSTELLNFEQSLQDIYEYEKGYFVIGIVICVVALASILLAIAEILSKRREKEKRELIKNGTDTAAIRYADFSKDGRILLKATVNSYRIHYRRFKTTNELIVNGKVYDEKKALIEFPHALFAELDGHRIEAGLDSNSFSYIRFDGKLIREKQRIV